MDDNGWTCDDTFYQETMSLGDPKNCRIPSLGWSNKTGLTVEFPQHVTYQNIQDLGCFCPGIMPKSILYMLFPYYLRRKRMENPSFLDDIHWFFRSNFHFEWISHCHVVRFSGIPIANFWWSWLNLGDICYLCVSSLVCFFFNFPMGNPLPRDSSKGISEYVLFFGARSPNLRWS